MKKIFPVLLISLISTSASAACISSLEKNVLKLQALIYGSIQLYVSHAHLGLGTPYAVVHAATTQSIAELNSEGPVVTLTYEEMPYVVPGFFVYATAAGVEKLHQTGYCYGRWG